MKKILNLCQFLMVGLIFNCIICSLSFAAKPQYQQYVKPDLAVVFVEKTWPSQTIKIIEYSTLGGSPIESVVTRIPNLEDVKKLDMTINSVNDIDIVYLQGPAGTNQSQTLYHIFIPRNNLGAMVGPNILSPPSMVDFDLDIDVQTGETYLAATEDLFSHLDIAFGRKSAGQSIFQFTNPYTASLAGNSGGGVEIAHNNTTNTFHISYNPFLIGSYLPSLQELILDQSGNFLMVQNIDHGTVFGNHQPGSFFGQANSLRPSIAAWNSGGLSNGIYVGRHNNFANPLQGWNTPVLVSSTGNVCDLQTLPVDSTPVFAALSVLEGGFFIIPNIRISFYWSTDFVNWNLDPVASQPGGLATGYYSELDMPKETGANVPFAMVTKFYNLINGTENLQVHTGTIGAWQSYLLKTNYNSSASLACVRAEWLK